MASDAVVNLVVNAADADAQVTTQIRRIADDAERRAPTIDLRVDVDVSRLDRRLQREFGILGTRIDSSLGAVNTSIQDGFSDLSASLVAELRTVSQQLNTVNNNVVAVNSSVRTLGDNDGMRRLADDTDRADDSTHRLSATFSSLGRGAAGLALTASRMAVFASAAAGALPIVAGLATEVANLAPASAALVTGFVAAKAAALTLKIGLTGVQDAISAVLDPDADPQAVADALKNLSGNAKSFVLEIQKAKPALDSLRLDVQDKLFQGLDKTLAATGKATLPILRKSALDFAGTFNQMAKGVGESAQEMAEDGTLGKALKSGSDAFARLEKIPGQVLTAIGQLAVGGGPLLNKLTDRIAELADSLTTKLTKASESGALQKAIDGAADSFAQLGRIAGNVFEALGNIFEIANGQGEGLFGTLEKLTQALADATASTQFQETLTALLDLAGTLADVALPLLEEAFKALTPVVQTLAPVFEEIILRLQDELMALIPELAPALEELAGLFGDILIAILPLIEEGIQVLIDNMPELTELFAALRDLVLELTPIIEELAPILGDILSFAVQALTIVLTGLTLELGLVADAIDHLLEITATLVTDLSGNVEPAITSVSQLLNGDFKGSLDTATTGVINFTLTAAERFDSFSAELLKTTNDMFVRFNISADGAWAGFISSTAGMITTVTGLFSGLKDRLISIALSIAGQLYSAGQALVSAFSDGIVDQTYKAVAAARDMVQKVRDYLPFSPAKTGPLSGRGYPLYSGRAFTESFAQGIAERAGLLQSVVSSTLGASLGVPALSFGTPGGLSFATGSSALSTAAQTVVNTAASPVNVYLGNELVRDYVTVVVGEDNAARDRLAAQGIRG